MQLKLIAAIGKNNELGLKNSLPLWNLQKDFKRFRELTTGQIVVMGRKTFESLPEKVRPLPNRRNIILTRDPNFKIEGAESFASLEQLLHSLEPLDFARDKFPSEIWIMGGGEIYKQLIDKVDELHITHVDGEFVADTFFPEINKNIWQKVSEEKNEKDDKNSHPATYTIYRKIKG